MGTNDRDGDGILDPKDQCPSIPENRNGYLDHDGCPDVIPPPSAGPAANDLDNDGIKDASGPMCSRARNLEQIQRQRWLPRPNSRSSQTNP